MKISYEKALAELMELQQAFENNDISVDQIAKKMKRANELLQHCKNKLREVEKDVQKTMED